MYCTLAKVYLRQSTQYICQHNFLPSSLSLQSDIVHWVSPNGHIIKNNKKTTYKCQDKCHGTSPSLHWTFSTLGFLVDWIWHRTWGSGGGTVANGHRPRGFLLWQRHANSSGPGGHKATELHCPHSLPTINGHSHLDTNVLNSATGHTHF